jgi:hypothetical protein
VVQGETLCSDGRLEKVEGTGYLSRIFSVLRVDIADERVAVSLMVDWVHWSAPPPLLMTLTL